jgi:iron complex transport system substrate-binding protein
MTPELRKREGERLRVASLLPSTTEMVCALGGQDALVGVSHECDWPVEVVGLPVLTSAKGRIGRAGARSGEIDAEVRGLLRDALAVYDIDVEALSRARPDVILTQDLCDVCAVSFEDVVCAARALANPDVRIVNLHPTRLEDIFADIGTVGAAIGSAREAEHLVAALRKRVEAVRARAARATSRPNVLTIEWIDPVMVGGTWMPELVELCGGRALVAQPGDHAPTLTIEALRELDPAPDVVLVKPCGFVLERTLRETDVLHDLFSSVDWPAVRARNVWIADGNAYFNRPGPRIADSLEILAACVHPTLFADMAAKYAGAFVRFEEPARCT